MEPGLLDDEHDEVNMYALTLSFEALPARLYPSSSEKAEAL